MGNTCKPLRYESIRSLGILNMEVTKSCELCHGSNSDESDAEQPCLSACETCLGHATYCRGCWKKWILSCEERRLPTPTCPNCRGDMGETQIQDILGRKYQPAPGINVSSELAITPPDADLLDAMNDLGYRRCTNCRAWIEREQGCAAMQCLCGERFCFDCGLSINATPTCQCHATRQCQFYNNATGRHEPEEFTNISYTNISYMDIGVSLNDLRQGTSGWVCVGSGRWVRREEALSMVE